MSDGYTTPGWDWRTMINPDGGIIAAALAEQNRFTFDPRKLHTHRPAPPMNYEATNPWGGESFIEQIRRMEAQAGPGRRYNFATMQMEPASARIPVPTSCPRCGSRLIEQDHRICSDLSCGWEMPLIRKADPS